MFVVYLKEPKVFLSHFLSIISGELHSPYIVPRKSTGREV